jgi:putative transposase
VKSYDKVVVEDLNYKAMMENSKNAKNYEDISWGTFVNRLQQKGEVYNCNVIKADRFFPSSQICHVCGFKNIEVKEKHLDNWICPNCGASHQRDANASINLKNYVPLEQRKLTTVKNGYAEHLATIALQVGSFDEAVSCKVTNTNIDTL